MRIQIDDEKFYALKRSIVRHINLNLTFFKVISTLSLLCFCLVYPFFCFKHPYSIYWFSRNSQDVIQEATVLNHENFIAAKNIVKTARRLHPMDRPELAVGVITVKRTMANRALGYLTQVMAALDVAEKEDALFSNIQMFICDTYAGPGPHTEADLLAQRFIRVRKYPQADPSAVIMDRFEKEKQDYVFCLQEAVKYTPRHILLLEDDAVPLPDMLQVLHAQLQRLERHRHGEWRFLKLFYPERWQGYSTEWQTMLELISIGSLFGLLFMYLFKRTATLKLLQTQYIHMQCVAFLCGNLFAIGSCFAIGRPYLLNLKRVFSPYLYSTHSAPDCCSPAIAFPLAEARLAAHFLNHTVCHHKFPLDMAIARFAREYGGEALIVEPNLVKHVGLVSTIKGISSSPWEFL